jgi:hypothetical protein
VDDLKASAAELMALDEEHYDDRRQAERELKRLNELVADTSKQVESLKKETLGKKRSYAIVPYDGPNGTTRRPIYIECRRDAVIIQPEGIKLTQEDFMPPLDAGSPLAAALRAAREELIRSAPVDENGKRREPYPLILVRPDGIEAYYAVRRVVAEWDSEFGYEFVDGDWQLSFQPPDPKLAMIEKQAVEHARIRRQALAMAAPRAYRSGGGGGGYGFGRAEGDDEFAGTGVGGDGDGLRAGTANAAGPRTGDSTPAEAGGSPYGNLPLGNADDGRYASRNFGSEGGDASGSGGNQSKGPMDQGPAPAVTGAIREPVASARNSSAVAGAGGASSAGAGEPAGGPQVGEASGTTGGNTEHGPSLSGTTATASNSGSTSAASGGGSPAPSTSGASGASFSTANVNVSPQEFAKDLSETRGENWALEGRGLAAVPVRRSIRVIVRNDRFAILPDGATFEATAGGREIPLTESTSQHVDEIVAAVQQEVRGWGIAGRGLYWRPVLVMQVGPEGDARAGELTRLLRNSGIELRPNSAIGQRGNQATSKR